MKKVRFETPTKLVMASSQDYECHSPRPLLERQIVNISHVNQPRPVVFTNDPVHRFENGNCSPYPTANKTYLNSFERIHEKKLPCSDLDLSILDCSQSKCKSISLNTNTALRTVGQNRIAPINFINNPQQTSVSHRVLTPLDNNTNLNPPTTRNKYSDFFLRRNDLGIFPLDPIQQQLNHLSLNKENNPVIKKNDLVRIGATNIPSTENYTPALVEMDDHCRCHHCIKTIDHEMVQNINRNVQLHPHSPNINYNPHSCVTPSHNCSCTCNMHIVQPTYHCNVNPSSSQPQNAVDKKIWAIEKYEKAQKVESLDIEKQTNVFKEKREPTVSDLFKIIKLQNEQLQLLQEKVDKFISTHHREKEKLPVQSYLTDQMAVETVIPEQHKISIGVMTSLEMVCTSTVINKEIVKQSEAQIQCNRSQISIKEVVSKKQAGNLNFLDGIQPVRKNMEILQTNENHIKTCPNTNETEGCQPETVVEDKTLNELSLCNVQVDNAITPLMSPEQSLYLDIRDYSESDSGSDDQSNVGWTYYNKVMTHVNGMLQDSDMPSSASALYRHTKKQCMQMQIDKSNVSTGKRVTFGDAPLDIQNHVCSPSDTSLKMNQLAVKYLKSASPSHTPSLRASGEMSFATKNYMKRHNLLQGHQQGASVQADIPRFLDITALKQQTKLI